MRPFLERITSRKFLMTLAAFLVGGLKAVYPDFPDEALWALIGTAMGYVAIEGGIDAAAQLAKWGAVKREEKNAPAITE